MYKNLKITSSPHLKARATTHRIMLDVCIALLPAGAVGVWFFGSIALALIISCVSSAVIFEYVYQRATHSTITIGDLSAVVTGLLVAYNLPANAPLWIGVFGSALAIILIKQIFGGIGHNFMNPAMAARVILFVSFSTIMSSYPLPNGGVWKQGFDTVASATPLSMGVQGVRIQDLLTGNIPGVLGETSKIAILIGGLYLLIRKVINWRIPVVFIGTVFICYTISNNVQTALFHILSGGLLLGAVFMATDYVTSPITPFGKVLMGFGCGIILFLLRQFSVYPEGCSFAILFMNVVTPLIDKATFHYHNRKEVPYAKT